MATASKSVVVAVGGGRQDLKQVSSLVAGVLKSAGCGGCLSGFDIHLLNETEFFTHNAHVAAKQVHVEG